MRDREHQRLMSEISMNRALIWLVLAWFTENRTIAVLFFVPVITNVWRSYREWPE